MTFSILNSLLCCCNKQEVDIYDEHDGEGSQLIPDNHDYSDPTLVDQERIRKRLGMIVRAKEGKMVNIGSHVPFNFHNQVLRPGVNLNHSLSRPISGSFDLQGHPRDDYHGEQQPYPHDPHSQFSTSPSPDLYGDVSRLSRPGSPERGLRPNPDSILNIRLVNFVDQRGRTQQRTRESGLEPGSDCTVTTSTMHNSTPQPENVSTGPETWPPLGLSNELKLQEVGAISLSWGD